MRHVRRAVREGANLSGKTSPTGVNGVVPLGVGHATAASPWPMSTLVTLELHLAMDMILTACR